MAMEKWLMEIVIFLMTKGQVGLLAVIVFLVSKKFIGKWGAEKIFWLTGLILLAVRLVKTGYYIDLTTKVVWLVWLVVFVTSRIKWGTHRLNEKTGKYAMKSLYERFLTKLLVIVVLATYVLPFLAGTLFYQIGWVTVETGPKLVVDREPVEWRGAPLANLPEGMVIPWKWETISRAVSDEGGGVYEAILLYATSVTECNDLEGNCVSVVGAKGWFQFMDATWKIYADSEWSPYDLYQSARAAYRMFNKLGLFNQSSLLAFQNRFTGLDGGLAWNLGYPGSGAYDGWAQSEVVWENAQAIIRLAGIREEKQTGVRIEASLSELAPADQVENVRIWVEKNPKIEILPGSDWDFCRETERSGWDTYQAAGGYLAGGICANASLVYKWASQVEGLEVIEAYQHSPQSYPIFTHAVLCPGMTLKITNVTSRPIVGEWRIQGDLLILEQVLP